MADERSINTLLLINRSVRAYSMNQSRWLTQNDNYLRTFSAYPRGDLLVRMSNKQQQQQQQSSQNLFCEQWCKLAKNGMARIQIPPPDTTMIYPIDMSKCKYITTISTIYINIKLSTNYYLLLLLLLVAAVRVVVFISMVCISKNEKKTFLS